MDRGATDGERAAGEAVATRVAAAAGLSLADAIGIVDAHQARTVPGPHPGAARRPHSRRTYAWAQPKQKPEPITVEELLRQKEADLARKKKAAYRSEPPEAENVDFERWAAEAREAQAERDRAWAERQRQREEVAND